MSVMLSSPALATILFRDDIGKYEAVTIDNLADGNRDWRRKHGACRHDGVKLSVLSARIDAFRKLAQQFTAEFPAREIAGEIARIDANEVRHNAGRNHLHRQCLGVALPEREQPV